jgi:hypothetical protein
MEVVNYIAFGIGIGAVSVICWGVLLGLIRCVKLEIQRTRGGEYMSSKRIAQTSSGVISFAWIGVFNSC